MNVKHDSASLGSIASFFENLPAVIESELSAILALRSQRISKTDGSYVTKGDLLAQELVMRFVEQSFPGSCVVSEELNEPIGESDADCVFVIDPSDGTENFTSGLPEWGISICCYQRDRHVHSWIGCPKMHQWLGTGDKCEKFVSRASPTCTASCMLACLPRSWVVCSILIESCEAWQKTENKSRLYRQINQW